MKHLIEYINESIINEGGVSVEGAEKIRGDLAKIVADEVIDIFHKKFDKALKCAAIGSTGKKGKNQLSGDIDIAVEKSWDEYEDLYNFIKNNLNISAMANVNPNLHVFNFGYKYKEDDIEKIVQIDIMFVNDLEFAEFAYHSPNFITNESKYKGMYQSQLLISAIVNTPVEEVAGNKYKQELFTNEYDGKYKGDVKTFWKFNFSQGEGVSIHKKSYEGKTKPVKNPKTIQTVQYSHSVSKILKEFLGDSATKESCNSFESLMEYLVSDDYKFRSKEMMEKIKESFMNDWQMKLKTSDELMKQFGDAFDYAIKIIK